jgi:hypothetical protein
LYFITERKIVQVFFEFYLPREDAQAKGEVLFQKRTSPFGTPKRKTGGVSISPPAPPNDQKGGEQPLLFGLSSPLF